MNNWNDRTFNSSLTLSLIAWSASWLASDEQSAIWAWRSCLVLKNSLHFPHIYGLSWKSRWLWKQSQDTSNNEQVILPFHGSIACVSSDAVIVKMRLQKIDIPPSDTWMAFLCNTNPSSKLTNELKQDHILTHPVCFLMWSFSTDECANACKQTGDENGNN